MSIGTESGVFVEQNLRPLPLQPQPPQLPTAIVGPMYRIARGEELTSLDGVDFSSTESVAALQFPGMKDEGNPVECLEIRVRRRSGHEVVLYSEDHQPTFIQIIGQSVEIDFHSGKLKFEEINDQWNGDEDLSALDGATLVVDFNELRKDQVGRVILAQGVQDTREKVGQATLENPLGMAGYFAASVAPTTAVYYVPTMDYDKDVEINDTEEVGEALSRIEPIRVHNVVALSDNVAVHNVVLNHCNSMSTKEERMYRVGWGYKSIPKDTEILNNYDDITTISELTEKEYKRRQAELLNRFGQSIGDQRMKFLYQPFTTTLNGKTKEIPGQYLAVIYASFKSTLAPQQGLTRYPVNAPIEELLYGDKYFKPSYMKKISEGGIWACTQSMIGANIQSRGQWTTNMLNNKTQQASVIDTVDYISFMLMDTLDPLLGVNNVTPEIMETIEKTMNLVLSKLRKEGQLISGEIIELFQDPNNSSRVKVKLKLVIPTPLDQIVIVIEY